MRRTALLGLAAAMGLGGVVSARPARDTEAAPDVDTEPTQAAATAGRKHHAGSREKARRVRQMMRKPAQPKEP